MSLIKSLYYLMNPILVVVVIVLRLDMAHGNAHTFATKTQFRVFMLADRERERAGSTIIEIEAECGRWLM